MEQFEDLMERLNDKDKSVRLNSLIKLNNLSKHESDDSKIEEDQEKPNKTEYVNNHIHTKYSFSPYSPTKAVWMAQQSGLKTAGIMDHDSICGAEEFTKAGRILGMATTIGVECRVDFSKTKLKGKRINNPDQKSIAYMALHGIPHGSISSVKAFFKPYMEKRNKRNLQMVDRINDLMKNYDVSVDFSQDIVPISYHDAGGSITERHLLFALGNKMIERHGRGESLVSFLKDRVGIPVSAKIESWLMDKENPYYEYDLLGLLKSNLVGKIYVEAVDECPDVRDVIELSNLTGAISAYAYLGDVKNSVTGDKKSQKFEDEYIDLLFEELVNTGFNAVTYMPTRNTPQQLERIKILCDKYDLFQISGEDINSPRQSFICSALEKEEFSNLIDATWALIGHEKAATFNKDDGMFSIKTKNELKDLEARINRYKEIGKTK